jgi:hypothetical protein
MSFDLEAALNGLKALVETVPAMESVQIGAPESLSNRIAAWITIGDPGGIGSSGEPTAGTWAVQGIADLDINLIIWMGYVVEGSEQAAEAQLADYVSELTRRLIQNRMGTVGTVTRNLNGTVDRLGLPQAAAGISDYTMMAGSETRTYPLGIRVTQREVVGV